VCRSVTPTRHEINPVSVPDMDAPAELLFSDLVRLMTEPSGAEPSFRGVVATISGEPQREEFGYEIGKDDPPPVFLVLSDDENGDQRAAVWRDGALLRIADGTGRPVVIVGDEHCWVFDTSSDSPVQSPVEAIHGMGDTHGLVRRRKADDFVGNDFARPTGPVTATTYLGRLAWAVELAPPAHKPYPLQLVVDAETGLVLQQRNDGFGIAIGWTELTVGDDLDPALFTWDGPVRWWEDERAAQRDLRRAEEEARLAWFTANVAPAPFTVEVTWGVRLHRFHDDGTFEASLGTQGGGMLARRPRSADDWDLHWSEVQHRWTTGGWEWALTIHDASLTVAGLLQLREQLARGPAGG
jgi:hypothetical protein